MITMFNAKTVYLGFDLQEMREMEVFLRQNGVKYRVKRHNLNNKGRQHGSMGVRPNYSTLEKAPLFVTVFLKTVHTKFPSLHNKKQLAVAFSSRFACWLQDLMNVPDCCKQIFL